MRAYCTVPTDTTGAQQTSITVCKEIPRDYRKFSVSLLNLIVN